MKKNKLFPLLVFTFLLFSCGTQKKVSEAQETPEYSANTSTTSTIEKPVLNLGFLKLTDMAPLAIAIEKGYFEGEGLFVVLKAQSNWRHIFDRVVDGQLDGAQMLAGQPIAASVGFGRQAELVTLLSTGLNGNAITINNEIWASMKPHVISDNNGKPIHPISAKALQTVIESYRDNGKPFKMGIEYPVSGSNYEIRYWLAAAGIHPGLYSKENVQGQINSEVLLSVCPTPQMPAVLESGTVYGYSAGEPWNTTSVLKSIGVPVTTNYDIRKNGPNKVFVMSKKFVEKYPNTAVAVTKALIRAAKWLDNPKNHEEAIEILALPQYVGANESVLENAITGTFEFEKGAIRDMPDFNVFYDNHATYPFYSDGIWFLTQMRRWGQIPSSKPAAWYHKTIKDIYRPDIWVKAANSLLKEGHLKASEIPTTDGYKSASKDFIDKKEYNGKNPIEYLNSFNIGNKD